MKHSVTKIFILAVFFASAMILGCGEGEKPPETTIQEKQEEAKEEIKEIQEEVKEEAGDVVDSVTEFTFEKKEEYTTAINEQLLGMEGKIQELKDHAQALEGEAREKLEQQIANLSDMHQKAANALSGIKEQGMEGWSEAVQSLDNALDQMEQAYQDIKSKIE